VIVSAVETITKIFEFLGITNAGGFDMNFSWSAKLLSTLGRCQVR
jgi:hypothetical protein